MLHILEIAFELFDWKKQPDWVKVLSVFSVVIIIGGALKQVL